MSMQWAVMAVAVAGSLAYLGRATVRTWWGRAGCTGCGTCARPSEAVDGAKPGRIPLGMR